VKTLKTYLSRSVYNYISIRVRLVQFRIREHNFMLVKSTLVHDTFWTDSDFSLSDLSSVYFAGLV
jgi:hypothetical protein